MAAEQIANTTVEANKVKFAKLQDASDDVCEVLGETLDLHAGLQSALDISLKFIGEASGAIYVGEPGYTAPTLTVTSKASKALIIDLEKSESPLREGISWTLENDLPSRIETEEVSGTVIPLSTKFGPQAAMYIEGAMLDDTSINGFQSIAKSIARAIQARRLQIAAIKQYTELANILTLSAKHAPNLEFDEIQTMMVTSLRRAMDVDAAAIVLLQENDEAKSGTKILVGRSSEETFYEAINREPSLMEKCIEENKVLLVNDIKGNQDFNPYVDGSNFIDIRSMLCSPLTINQRNFGALFVYNKRVGHFNSLDEDFLASMATAIANMQQNMQLIRQLTLANANLVANRWELLHSRNTLRSLFDSIPMSMYIVDHKYQLIAINAHRASPQGQHPSDLVGIPCYQGLYNRNSPCDDCRVVETIMTNDAQQRTLRRWNLESEPLEQNIITYPILDENKKTAQVIVVEEDVTEQRQMEAHLAQSEKLAAIGQLAAGLAHEINNPLTAIIANTQLLQRQKIRNAEVKEAIDLIGTAGARASQVVRNLLDLSRQESYEYKEGGLNETIEKAMALLKHEIVSRHVQIEFEADETLEPINMSEDHLVSVWLNLIINALDALSGRDVDASEEAKIWIRTQQRKNEILVTVADNGTGIPENQLSRIFNPFFTTKDPGEGTGLGLPVCHRIIKQHGGNIMVDSDIGTGTKFTINLPI
ncbi:MAG: GAF domain-containing protein [Chloroflexi bacterium]|nr:MAG: GAF domain-containing protein [Chloroflexota bacterium]MBL1194805.1 GAF domain-containing protein [Chloroflexota bacterium]NOH12096.1 GAF domain-containing protein [Chloroflexota bacterium]